MAKSKPFLWLSGLTLLVLAWAVAPRVIVPAPVPAKAAESFDLRGRGRPTVPPTVAADSQGPGASLAGRNGHTALPDDSAPDLDQLVDRVPLENIPSILQSFGQDSDPTVREFELLLVRKWAEGFPAEAAGWAAQLPSGEATRQALSQVALGWTQVDLPGALQWVASLPESETKGPIMLAAVYEAARTEPVMAIELGRVLPVGAEREKLLVYAARQWADIDSTAAAAWAVEVTDVPLRERLLAAILVAGAASNPHHSATRLADALAGGPEQARAAVAIVQQWAQVDPAQAAQWVVGFPEDDTGTAAVDNLVRHWSLRDSAAAEAWVRALPEGKLQQAGRLALGEPVLADAGSR